MILNRPRFVAAVSSRPHNMSLAYGDTGDSLANRKNFLEGCAIDYRDLVCCRQVHGSGIRYVAESERGRGALSHDDSLPDTDALFTDQARLPLAVFTADCLSIFLYAARPEAIAVVHAGWRSSRDRIAAKTVGLMQERLRIDVTELRVEFGPAIRSCCYEVGEEFRAYFPDGAVAQRGGRHYLDLAAVNRRQLCELGVREENISDCGLCTACKHDTFFSFRREGSASGRMISVAMLR